jgi:hypothetical protein
MEKSGWRKAENGKQNTGVRIQNSRVAATGIFQSAKNDLQRYRIALNDAVPSLSWTSCILNSVFRFPNSASPPPTVVVGSPSSYVVALWLTTQRTCFRTARSRSGIGSFPRSPSLFSFIVGCFIFLTAKLSIDSRLPTPRGWSRAHSISAVCKLTRSCWNPIPSQPKNPGKQKEISARSKI